MKSTLNNALAELLDGMFSQSQVRPENTDIIADKPSKRPDISSLWSNPIQQAWGYNSARSANPVFLSSGLKNRPQKRRLRRLESSLFSQYKSMEPSHQDERIANQSLSRLIKRVMPGRQTRAESTNILAGEGNAGLKPDIVITAPGRSPVIIEAEYMPAREVENDADLRVGRQVVNEAHPIEAVIAVRYPAELAAVEDMEAALEDCRLSYCAIYSDKKRFPKDGWLEGSVSDLADLIHLVDVPRSAFYEASNTLMAGIQSAVSVLENSPAVRLTNQIASLLGLANVHQTRRMACAIIVNALIFQERLAGIHKHIPPLDLTCGRDILTPKTKTIEVWNQILAVNYWPIFAIGRDILRQLPFAPASKILRTLAKTTEAVHSAGLIYAHNLTGHVFQQLIIDRKYLAAFYTLPESAALLARLAVAKMQNINWSDAQAIGQLRIADFACGTGALLSAVYDQITTRHERAGGKVSDLYKVMMEQVLYGFDVMPSAVHISSSTLSGAHPSIDYEDSRLYTMPYGRQKKEDSVKIGSLEFLQTDRQFTLINTTDPAKRTGSAGEETASQILVEIPDNSLDMVIMNPPFVCATNHEGPHADVVNPAFAAFEASPEDQTVMGKRLNELGKGTCYHGNAGISSAFAALADKKLKPGGILALILPLTVAAGSSWQKLRTLLAKDYDDIEVISIAANGKDMAFSADTGMADCLVVGRKRQNGETPNSKDRFISLLHRPAGFVASSEIAKQLDAKKTKRKLEDGPFGGDEFFCGQQKMGETITATVHQTKPKWNPVRIQDFELVQTAYALAQSKLWLPGQPKPLNLKMSTLDDVGKLGLLSRDIIGPAPRGPFTKTQSSRTATYPALWNHHAELETELICQPDCSLRVRPGMETKANKIWETFAGRSHLTVNFTLGS